MITEKFKIMIITGAAGFIGSHVVEECKRRGLYPICVDNLCENNLYDRHRKELNVNNIITKNRYDLYKLDICDSIKMFQFANHINETFDSKVFDIHIIHLAAIASISDSANINKYINVNVNGTANVIKLAEKIDANSITFASSSAVYGRCDIPTNETCATKPINLYGITKLTSEQILMNCSSIKNIGIMRYFNVVGERLSSDLVFYKFIDSIINNKPIIFYGDGTSSRDYVYVKDVAYATVESALNNKGKNIYNVSRNKNIYLKDITDIMFSSLNKYVPIIFKNERDCDVKHSLGDNRKLYNTFNFIPQNTIDFVINNIMNNFVEYKKNIEYIKIG